MFDPNYLSYKLNIGIIYELNKELNNIIFNI